MSPRCAAALLSAIFRALVVSPFRDVCEYPLLGLHASTRIRLGRRRKASDLRRTPAAHIAQTSHTNNITRFANFVNAPTLDFVQTSIRTFCFGES